MQFNKVIGKSMRLGKDAKVSKTYIRQVEADSRLARFVEKPSEKKENEDINKVCRG